MANNVENASMPSVNVIEKIVVNQDDSQHLPIAGATSPGIASFDTEDFTVDQDGHVEISQTRIDNIVDETVKEAAEKVIEEVGIDEMKADIVSNTDRITKIETEYVQQENPVGQFSGPLAPNPDTLTAYVQQVEQRAPKNGDVIIYIQTIPDDTDKTFKCIYTSAGWKYYEIPPLEKASNSNYGIIKGTPFNTDLAVNIADGLIQSIAIRNNSGINENIRTAINRIDKKQSDIVSGAQEIGVAKTAKADALGNIINEHYLDVNAGATKQFVRDYALPKSFNDIYYIASTGYVDTVPTTPPDGKQFSKVVNTIGNTQLFNLVRTLQSNYTFTKKNSAYNTIWLKASVDCIVDFRLITKAKKSGAGDYTTINVESIGKQNVVANTFTKLEFNSNFSSLGDFELNLEIGDIFEQILEVVTTTNTAITFDIYSNAEYPSAFSLDVQTTIVNVNYIGAPAEIAIAESDFTLDDASGLYKVVIPQTTHLQPAGYKYILSLWQQTASNTRQFVNSYPSIDDSGDITIYTEQAENYIMLISSSITDIARVILKLTNPVNIPVIDYSKYGTIRVTQTEDPTILTLPEPKDVGYSFKLFVANDVTSTKNIIVNNEVIEPGTGNQFYWTGNWVVGEAPTDTDEVYDKDKQQNLDVTLRDIESAAAALKNSALTTGLENVQLDGLEEKMLDTRAFDWDYLEEQDDYNLKDTDAVNLLFTAQFIQNDQIITLTIPDEDNVKVIRLRCLQGNYTGCKLRLHPESSAVYINGASADIDITSDGFGGVLLLYYSKSSTGTNYEFIPREKINTIGVTIDDESTITKEVQTLEIPPYSGLEARNVPGKVNAMMLQIKPSIIAKTTADGYYAKLNSPVTVWGNKNKIHDGKIWCDDIIYSGSSYIYAERDTKSVICQETDDLDPNVTGGTPCLIKFFVDMGKYQIASRDGYVQLFIYDNETGTVLTDDNGNPMGTARRAYKQGDTFGHLIYVGIKSFKQSTKVGFVMEHDFDDALELEPQTCFAVQALEKDKKTSPADLAFNADTAYRFSISTRDYYDDLLNFSWLINETLPEQIVSAGQTGDYVDGLHLDSVTNVKFSVANKNVTFRADGASLCYFGFGRVFDSTDTNNLKGKTLNVRIKCTNENNAYNVHLLKYTGDKVSGYVGKILTGQNNDSPVFSANWADSGEVFIIENIAGEHIVTGTLNVPNDVTMTRMAIMLIPVSQQNPCDISINEFDVSPQTGFVKYDIVEVGDTREDHLTYNPIYAKFGMNSQGFTAIRYTINDEFTKVPFGVKLSGLADINNVTCWQDNPAIKGEGGLNFVTRDQGQIRMQFIVYRGEGAISGQNENYEIALFERSSGKDTDPFDIKDFTEITGTRIAYDCKPEDTKSIITFGPMPYNIKQPDSTIIVAIKATHKIGIYLQTNSATEFLVRTDITGREIL